MDHPFLADHLSEIHEADTLYDSHFSASHLQQEDLFQEQRSFTRSVLTGWGMTLGDLPYNTDNQNTLRCLVELVTCRQKDLQFRSKAKEELAAVQFERDKFRSFAQQAQRAIEQHVKKIGTLENELAGLRTRGKKGEAQTRKEREDDRKVIAALRAKNEQVLHQIKKREAEAARVREQMKKSVGEKGKASFEVFLPLRAPSKEETEKYAFLLERNQRQLTLAVKENALLREKLFEIRDALVRFNAWIDRQIFGEQVEDSVDPPRAYSRKFFLNHNLLFKKESLTQELQALIDVTKDGLIQLREINRGNKSPPRLPEAKMEEVQLNFRKKPSRQNIKTDRIIGSQTENKPAKTSISKRAEGSSEHHSPRSNKPLAQQIHSEVTLKPLAVKQSKPQQQVRKVGTVVTRPIAAPANKSTALQVPFEDDLLSEVHDSSIISHISIEQMGRSRFDKWDILYQEE